MRRMRGVWAAAALVLAAALPGEGRAQELVERVERDCFAPAALTQFNEFEGLAPPGARCFVETFERTSLAWSEFITETLVCPVGDFSCQAAYDQNISEYRQNRLIVVELDGVEILRQQSTLAGAGVLVSTTFSETTSRTETVTTENTLLREDVIQTRMTGRVEGTGQVFDRTLDVPVTDPLTIGALNDATLAVTAAGGPGVIVLDAVRLERTETFQSSTAQTERSVIGDPVETFSLQAALGGNLVAFEIGERTGPRSGDLGLCATPGATNVAPSGCENSESWIIVPFGTTNINVNLNTHTDILETVTTTEVWRIFEHWEVVGVLRALGEIHAAVQSGARDLGQRLLRRMGDEAQAPRGFALTAPGVTVSSMGGPGVALHGWVEGYGLRGRVGATGGTEAERRHARGIAAGLTWVHPDGLTWGIALDHGRGSTDIAAAGERAGIRLTQGALMVGMHRPGGFVSGTLTFGSGEVTATTTLGGTASATYGLRTLGAQVEAGWHLTAGDWRLTPSVGLDWTRVRSGAFTAGGIAAAAHSADRTRAFAGIAASRDWQQGTGVLSLDASARVVHVLGGTDRLLPVGVGGAGLAITAGPDGRTGLDLGLGLTWRQGRAEARLGYLGRFRDGARDHALTAGLRLRW